MFYSFQSSLSYLLTLKAKRSHKLTSVCLAFSCIAVFIATTIVPAVSGEVNLVKDIQTGYRIIQSNPQNFVHIGDTAYFIAKQDVYKTRLWKSDGTVKGTVMLRDIFGGNWSELGDLIVIDDILYFIFYRFH